MWLMFVSEVRFDSTNADCFCVSPFLTFKVTFPRKLENLKVSLIWIETSDLRLYLEKLILNLQTNKGDVFFYNFHVCYLYMWCSFSLPFWNPIWPIILIVG